MSKPKKWQRQRHWQGQMLKSRDFNDQFQKEAQLRWWHNRALHAAYGVEHGYEVTANQPSPIKTLVVEPGLAYDCFGRELRLSKTETIQTPVEDAPPDGWVLLVTYPAGESIPARRVAACLPGDVLWDEVKFHWRPARKVSIRDGVPLRRLLPDGSLDAFFRPYKTRPLAQPRIGRGTTIAGNTNWTPWQISIQGIENNGVHLLGLEITIDTHKAEFTDVPCYFAWFSGGFRDPALALFGEESFFFRAIPRVAAGLPLNTTSTIARFKALATTFGHIYAPAASQFTFRVWMPWLNRLGPPARTLSWLLEAAKEVAVCWIGIQDE